MYGDQHPNIEGRAPGDTPSGADTLNGGDGPDVIYGDGGQDGLNGDACRDQLDGDYAFDGTMRGRDTLSGGGGADSLRGGPAPDKLYGGPANDTVNSLDGVKDRVIDCDRGTESTAFFGIAQDVGSRTQRLSGHFEPRLSLFGEDYKNSSFEGCSESPDEGTVEVLAGCGSEK